MKHTARHLTLVAALSLVSLAASAGRPLAVDDANTNDKGKGHVEAWLTKADGVSLFSIAPAYAVGEGLEIGGLLSRESNSGLRVSAAQLKWRITASQAQGCNVAATLGVTRASIGGASASGSYVTGLGSCNFGQHGSAHANLGMTRVNGGGGTATSWGIAYERAFGAVTPHIEWFGSEGSKPTLQIGLRGQVADNLQLDGSVGVVDGETIYSLGVKFTF
ncbi:MAG: hypothetical protein JNJ71_05480 [Rubrivivax sp.]|nr:hypothetical protein [Rubrivivax sp.]